MRRRVSTTAAAAGLVLATALGVTAVRSGSGDAPRPAAIGGDVVADRSTRVGGTGTVLLMTGERPRFCSEYGWDREAGVPKVPAPLPDCDDMLVWVEGVDVDRLTGLTTRDFGGSTRTWGMAYLEGEVRDDVLHVDHQGPPREPTRKIEHAVVREANTVPCPEPPGGWPAGVPVEGSLYYEPPDRGFALDRYDMSAPDNVVRLERRWHTKRQPVQVLVVVEPDRVPAAVRRAAGRSLCLLRSRYTPTQVADTEAAARQWSLRNRARAVPGEALDGQAQVTLYVPVLTPDVAAFVASQPEGLVAPEPWLVPVE